MPFYCNKIPLKIIRLMPLSFLEILCNFQMTKIKKQKYKTLSDQHKKTSAETCFKNLKKAAVENLMEGTCQ